MIENPEDILPWAEGWGRYCGIGPGWYQLVLDLHNKLIELDPDYQVCQVKSKFGGLRYYTADMNYSEDSPFYAAIRDAETESYKVCEECSRPGKQVNVKGWYATLCGQCG